MNKYMNKYNVLNEILNIKKQTNIESRIFKIANDFKKNNQIKKNNHSVEEFIKNDRINNRI
jgi:hypothetical protein